MELLESHASIRRKSVGKVRVRDSGLFGSRFVGIAIAAYVVLVLAASFYFKISLSVDRVAILIVIAALGTGKIRSFLRDWSAFLVVILAWQVLQGMSQSITHIKPHITEMIVVDKFLFLGRVPTIWLQQHFYHPGHIAWYDIAATILYSMHFLMPLAIGFVLWIWKRPVFAEFTGSFMLLALAGFATYMLFPAAPPWWAAKHHYLPHVTKIFQYGLQSLGGKQSYSSVTQWAWQHGGWDVFGAMPSEHAALPFL
jgi:hypothetical protein